MDVALDEQTRRLLPLLPAFVAVAEVEQVTLAAAMLRAPQPTVSRAVARVGEVLGVPVVERHGRGIRLTDAGRVLLPHARRALAALGAGVDAVRSSEALARGTLSVAFQTSLGESVVPALIKEFLAGHPAVRFTMTQGARRTCLDALAAGEADIALVSRLVPAPTGLDTLTLFQEPLVLMVPAGHELAGRTGATLRDAARSTFITLKHGYGLRGTVDALCAAAGVRPTIGFEGEDLHTVRGLVAAGLGVSVLPPARHPVHEGVELRLDEPVTTRDIGAAWSPQNTSPTLAAFVAMLRAGTPVAGARAERTRAVGLPDGGAVAR
ncbi:LysR family transcriptional regulator [Oerskovia enterophila]